MRALVLIVILAALSGCSSTPVTGVDLIGHRYAWQAGDTYARPYPTKVCSYANGVNVYQPATEPCRPTLQLSQE